jgi:hypothetical protein
MSNPVDLNNNKSTVTTTTNVSASVKNPSSTSLKNASAKSETKEKHSRPFENNVRASVKLKKTEGQEGRTLIVRVEAKDFGDPKDNIEQFEKFKKITPEDANDPRVIKKFHAMYTLEVSFFFVFVLLSSSSPCHYQLVVVVVVVVVAVAVAVAVDR